MSLIKELNRRNVFRVGVAYVIVAWLLLQVADVILPTFRTPDWVMQAFTFLLILGFPLALIFAWAFELTPEGLKLEKHVVRDESITHATGRKLDFVIIAMLVVALGFFAYDKFVLDPDRDAAEVEAAVQIAQKKVASAVEPQDSAKTIAVLPFLNMSDDPGNEYFSDGISEEILNLLAKVPEMRVTSRSSAFSFKGQNLDVPTMAARLNVAHVLEGSVRKSGKQLRITAQLIDVVTDTHLWSATYDRELENVFAIQDEIAAAVVDALKITLLGKKPKVAETTPEAYALYLQGRHFINQLDLERAETLLKQSLEIDSSFAPAWTDLGDVYERQTGSGLRSYDKGAELARNTIQKALAIDPQSGRAYAVLAEIEMFYDWDFAAAFQHMETARELNPGDSLVLTRAARQYSLLGRLDEAIDLHGQSIALDPVRGRGHYFLGRALHYAQRLDAAADSLQMALFLSPESDATRYFLGHVLLAQGDSAAALVEIEQMQSTGTIGFYRLVGTVVVQHALGDAAASDAALVELIEKYTDIGPYQIAQAYAFRGEIDNAFDWLEQGYTIHDPGMVQMLLDPLLANLRNDPRWEPFLDKMGLPH